jgi:hypothetical protein
VQQGADVLVRLNAHNVLAYGRDAASGDYQLSDPVVETTVTCAPADLRRARFAKGVLAPKGLLYYPEGKPVEPNWAKVLPKAIKKTTRILLDSPIPIIGVRGIRRLANAIGRLDAKGNPAAAKMFIGQVVRMQEEIGTGGGGFRFIYAAFLQEAAERLARPALNELSDTLIDIGDEWREFALSTARMIRDREPLSPAKLADKLRAIADREQTFFRDLRRAA